MKTVIIVVILVLLTSCTKGRAPITESAEMRTRCLNGVNYYLFREQAGYSGFGYMAPKFNKDGSLSLCESN